MERLCTKKAVTGARVGDHYRFGFPIGSPLDNSKYSTSPPDNLEVKQFRD